MNTYTNIKEALAAFSEAGGYLLNLGDNMHPLYFVCDRADAEGLREPEQIIEIENNGFIDTSIPITDYSKMPLFA